ncbi:hypothetical protein DNHGIG_24380 [Collibacillus ludicampi]|uniref:Uncharacterized protein n=1 Tax=Collibacillus ludicampi TaxID=2771369 RepID=A0AAV4LGD6_9BACL|nr:hypothetical protein DNHGIG_24380 [Collibacillus ludicampi]
MEAGQGCDEKIYADYKIENELMIYKMGEKGLQNRDPLHMGDHVNKKSCS